MPNNCQEKFKENGQYHDDFINCRPDGHKLSPQDFKGLFPGGVRGDEAAGSFKKDGFGRSVSISTVSLGKPIYIVVGAEEAVKPESSNMQSGFAAYVFESTDDGETWLQRNKLVGDDKPKGYNYDSEHQWRRSPAVSISGSGDTIAVGAYYDAHC